jgi:parallel beta-helix repeat protein
LQKIYQFNEIMRKKLLFILLLTTSLSFSTNYYVNANAANNDGSGTTPETAFRLLSTAQSKTAPGDTVFIMPGIYYPNYDGANVLDIYTSGTQGNYITYKAYNSTNKPVFQLTAFSYYGIYVQGANYIIIDGIIIKGNNDNVDLAASQIQNAATRGTGVYVAPLSYDENVKAKRVVVRNCDISKCGGAGVFAFRSDYITIDKNRISNCGLYTADYQQANAISVSQPFNSDATTGTKIYIRANTCFNNTSFYRSRGGSISGGNGILVVDYRNLFANSTQGKYTGKTFVANNVIYNNGGRGVFINESENISVANNTCVKNCTLEQYQTISNDGEIYGTNIGYTSIFNNVLYHDKNVFATNIQNISNNAGNVQNTITKNLTFIYNADTPADATQNPLLGDPKFVNVNANDFRLLSTSPAINVGLTTGAPTTDILGKTRVNGIDLGAYEYIASLREFEKEEVYTPQIAGYEVYPNPTASDLSIKFDDATITQIAILNQFGQTVITKNNVNGNAANLNVSDLPTGIYFVSVNGNQSQSKKFIKI